MTSYYDILGISKSASEKDVQQAFRRLARRFHPDLNPGDMEAESKFKRINEAYEVLSNPKSRRMYNMYGSNWRHAAQIEAQGRRGSGATFGWTTGASNFGGDFDFQDGLDGLLGQFGGTRRRQHDPVSHIEVAIKVTLEEAYADAENQIVEATANIVALFQAGR